MTKQLYGSDIAITEVLNSQHLDERKGRNGKTVKWVIVHGTASGTDYPATATANDFANRSDGVGTHYVVGYDGMVVQCTDERDSAWGSGVVSGPTGDAPIGGGDPNAAHDYWWNTHDCNDEAICIEHARSSDNKSPLSPIQKQASMYLVQDIAKRWNIPLQYATENGGVTGHYSVNPVSRAYCPGPGFFHPDGTSDWFIPGAIAPRPVDGNHGPGGPPPSGSGPVETPVTAIATGFVKLVISTPERVHQELISNPGMAGIVYATDEAEQFPGIVSVQSDNPVSSAVQSFAQTIAANFLPALIRSAFFLFGAVVLLAVALKAADTWL